MSDKAPPLVAANDRGLRNIKPGVCFYCDSAIGTEHKPDCVLWVRLVKIVVQYRDEQYAMLQKVPVSWSPEQIEDYYNRSSFCLGNLTSLILSGDEHVGGPQLGKAKKFCTCRSARVSLPDDWRQEGDPFLDIED